MLIEQEGLSEKVDVGNLGIAKKGPVIVERDQLMLEYTNGSLCEADGVTTTYTTRIHFVCSSGIVRVIPDLLLVVIAANKAYLIRNQWKQQYDNSIFSLLFLFSNLALALW